MQAADVDVAAILSALVLKAPLLNAPLAGTPTAPTPAVADNSTKLATTAWCRLYFADIVGAAPAALDTIAELATALQNNPDIITQILASIGLRALAASPTFTGKVLLPTGVAGSAPLRLPVPSANPSAPVSGDVWPDVGTGAWKYRLVATTLTFGALELAQTWTAVQTFGANVIVSAGNVSVQTVAGQAIGVAVNVAGAAGFTVNALAGAGNAAFMAFNRNGVYAGNFGIDTDNKWKVGGWSMGANAYEILHMGNRTTALPAILGPAGLTITDWNNALENGKYVANSAANGPTVNWYMGEVTNSGSYIQQTVWQFTASANADSLMWRRYYNGAAWGAWFRVYQNAVELQSLVQSTVAGLALGAIGTYALLGVNPAVNLGEGAVVAGSGLRYTHGGGFVGAGTVAPPGTWKSMGPTSNGGGSSGATVFLRVS